MAPFARLPDLCLLALFEQLPPVDQMSARRVCYRWSVLIAGTHVHNALTIAVRCPLVEAEHRLNRLAINEEWAFLKQLQNDDGSPLVAIPTALTKWNSLELAWLDVSAVSEISATFIGITFLQVFIADAFNCHLLYLIELLKNLGRHVVTLNIICTGNSPLKAPTVRSLSEAINSMYSLKYLGIDLHGVPPVGLTIYPRLTAFNIRITEGMLSLLLQEVEACPKTPTRIVYDVYANLDAKLLRMLKRLPEAHRRSIVRIANYGIGLNDFPAICANFRSITSLNLSPHFNLTTAWGDFFNQLSQLTQLIHLKLAIRPHSMTVPDDQPHRRLSQINSLKALQLFFSTSPHETLEPMNIEWTMPNIQAIHFYRHSEFSQKCETCGIRSFDRVLNLEAAKNCFRLMLAPLKKNCSKLKSIGHCYEDVLGTAEELLA